MFHYDKKSIYISIIMSAIIICSCIRPANSGTFTRMQSNGKKKIILYIYLFLLLRFSLYHFLYMG